MTRRKSYSSGDQYARNYSSMSESSFSNESGVESSCDSDASSDGLELGLDRKSEAQQKLKRLRRIFLNRPTKSKKKKENNQRRRHSPSGRQRSQLERRSSRSSVTESSHRRRDSNSSNSSSTTDDRFVDRLNKPLTGNFARPLQAAIDQHMKILWEQMKRHAAQRDSTANQVQSMLEQAMDELQFLKKQEERALESQVRLVRETYALRLEVLQQQYLNQVAEIEEEMYTSIQKRQEECDAKVLAAAKKMQDQTQHALLKDLTMMSSEPIEEQLSSSSNSTTISSASQSEGQRHRNVRSLRHNSLSSLLSVVPKASPVSQQRAKLQALEKKLAAFSPESINRVKNELATPVRSRGEKPSPKYKRAAVLSSRSSIGHTGSDDLSGAVVQDADEWRSSPLSPLRNGPSYWKRGISLEAQDDEESYVRGDNSKSDHVDGISSSKTRRQTPASLLSRRFLRPEEEEELRHLRTSIGLAKDWMAGNSQA